MTREPLVSYSPFSSAREWLTRGWQPSAFATLLLLHPSTLSTYAKKVTVSVLYSYEKLSGLTNRESLDLAPKGANFFFASVGVPFPRSAGALREGRVNRK